MFRNTLVALLVATLSLLVLPCPAGAEIRIALVVGNSAYPSGPIASPRDDAEAVARKLSSLGFTVIKHTDLGGSFLQSVIREFGHRLQQPGTVGLFYYSGHGMQVNNRNYMIPVDADIRDEADVEQYGVPMEYVLRRMELAQSNPNIVILDACRNNPFEKRVKSAASGLAPMYPPTGTVIAFAAAPGRVAEAGSAGRLSPYTQALIEHIDASGRDLIKMFQSVQNAVWQRTEGRQHPHVEFTPGLPEFSFKPMAAAVPAPVLVPVPPQRQVQPAVGVYPPAYGAFESFEDCNVCPKMVAIPAGTFLMGSPESEEGRFEWEGPQHEVTINPFAIGKYEVTFEEWDACVAAGGCNGYRPGDRGWGGKRPVINVSWRDAQAYVAWLAEVTGKPYRLPSEAEWEYAARAGTTTRYVGRAVGKTTEVGAFPANAWGLYDMHGNVWEWVEDVWHYSYEGAPADGSAWTDGEGKNSSSLRIIRGGSWDGNTTDFRSALRYWLDPDIRFNFRGFRVARTLD